MIRLSQRAWNNVLIFAMLFMILIFNTSHNFLVDSDDIEVIPLLPADALIMSIDFGPSKIERIGQSWRINSVAQNDSINPTRVIEAWQSAEIQQVNIPVTGSPMIAVAWLAGQSDGRVYQFFQEANLLLVMIDQQQYQVINAELSQLVLMESLD